MSVENGGITGNYTKGVVGTDLATGNAVIIGADPITHRLYCDVVVSSAVVVGAKSNNTAVPGSTNLGVLPAVATAAAPTYTETFQVALSTDLAGNLRTSSTIASDVAPSTQNITVIDSGSTTTAGANAQNLITGSPTAGSAASFSLSNIETVRVEVTGTWTGTINAEQSIDGGTTWVGVGLHQGAYTTGSFTANFVGGANIAGATNFRMRATAAITGTAVVKIIESINTQSVYVANAAPSGTVISVLNSSTATLLSGAIFTGTGEDVTNFSEMRVSVFSNVASGSDGLSMQQSTDNVNWDITDVYTIAAATGKTFVVPRQARYFRAVYTNGGTNQASFRLQTILNRTATAPSSNRASDAYTNETDLVQNQVFLMGYNGTTWDRLRAAATGILQVVLTASSAVIGHVITDTGSVTTIPAGATTIAKAEDVASVDADVGVPAMAIRKATPANSSGTDGDYEMLQMNGGKLWTTATIDQTTPGTTNLVALAANQSVNLAQVGGTNTVNGGLAGSQSVGGTVANNVTPTGNPVPVAGIAVSSEPSANTTTRVSQMLTDLVGKQIVLPYANPENFVSGTATATDTTSTSLVASPGGSLRNYITQITVWNASAVNTYVKIQDGSGGTTLYTIPLPATGGATLSFPAPLRQPTTATAIFFAANASANALFISASGYKGL